MTDQDERLAEAEAKAAENRRKILREYSYAAVVVALWIAMWVCVLYFFHNRPGAGLP